MLTAFVTTQYCSCTREKNKMVPKHYAEGLKIALMTEVNAMAQRSGTIPLYVK